MDNNPEKWDIQTWFIPHDIQLERNGKNWSLIMFYGSVRVDIRNRELAEYIANVCGMEYIYSEKKFRRSIPFRWERYWFLRRMRKEQGHKPTE